MDSSRSAVDNAHPVEVAVSAWDIRVTTTFQAHRSGLTVAAGQLVGSDHAADVVQEVFIRVWSDPAAYDESRSTLTHYLYMVVRHMSIDRLRSTTAQQARDLRHHATALPAQLDSDTALIDADKRRRVQVALGHLTEGQREAILAAFFCHLTYREVAVRLGVPEGTVKSRIRLGLVRLRIELHDL
ncbi:MAG: polymerase sigma factor SigK [Ilumatobacteraceae bacterium]|nr:polymerase sigma factor SigK [Ilumatobacteraceae bacterium]